VDEKLDLMVVLVASTQYHTPPRNRYGQGIPSYHIDSAERIRLGSCVEHRLLGGNLQMTRELVAGG